MRKPKQPTPITAERRTQPMPLTPEQLRRATGGGGGKTAGVIERDDDILD